MSELTSTRIRTTAAKLGLPHLAEALDQYVQRADEAKMGYLDFLDLVLAVELGAELGGARRCPRHLAQWLLGEGGDPVGVAVLSWRSRSCGPGASSSVWWGVGGASAGPFCVVVMGA